MAVKSQFLKEIRSNIQMEVNPDKLSFLDYCEYIDKISFSDYLKIKGYKGQVQIELINKNNKKASSIYSKVLNGVEVEMLLNSGDKIKSDGSKINKVFNDIKKLFVII